MYKSEKLHLRTHPISIPHNRKLDGPYIETPQEKYIREICEIAKVYVKSLMELERGI